MGGKSTYSPLNLLFYNPTGVVPQPSKNLSWKCGCHPSSFPSPLDPPTNFTTLRLTQFLTVYSLHLLCPQSQATSIPGIEHQSLTLNALPVLPQWPCWQRRRTTTLGTKTSVKPSNSPGEIQFPPTAYERTCLVRIWLPSRDTLSSWQSRSCQALSSLRPPCSCSPWPEHLPSPLLFVPVSEGRPIFFLFTTLPQHPT